MPRARKSSNGLPDLLCRNSSFHGIQYSLGSALGPYPDAKAAQLRQCVGDSGIHAIGSCDALERDPKIAPLHFLRIPVNPSVMDSEYIVGDPEHVRLVALNDPFDFIHHTYRPIAVGGSFHKWSGCTSGNDKGIPGRL